MTRQARFAAVLARWEEQGFVRGPAITPEELDAWEAHHGRTLPAEVREYFLALNGFEPGQDGMEELDFMSFRPLSELKPAVGDVPGVRGRRASSYFVFAANELWRSVYALRLRPGRNPSAEVVVVGETWHRTIAASLGEFLDDYLASTPDVLFPMLPASRIERVRAWVRRLFIPGGEIKPRLRNRGAVNRRLTRFLNRLVRQQPHLRRRRGAVKLRFRVNERGRAELVEVVDPGPIPEVTAEAVRMLARMRFSPARVNRCRVAVLVELPITFQLSW